MLSIKDLNEITTNLSNLKNEINAFIKTAKEKGIEISQNDFFDANQEDNNKYVYYIDGEKFTTENYNEIPWLKISSPDENTPAYEKINGPKIWYVKGDFWHRLTGPAYICPNRKEEFYLNGKRYANVYSWLKNHPNQDKSFKKEMLERWEEQNE
jgi:hypothetical protein